MTLHDLNVVSAAVRWFVLLASFSGLFLALVSVREAHRAARTSANDGDRLLLARSRRASEALSVAAQLTFVAVGLSFVSLPTVPLSNPSQVGPFIDGLVRIGGFGFGALVLALKSLLNLVTESRVAIPRQRREAAHLAEVEAVNRQLEAATRAKSEFLANMSHELRTPLNAVLGFSDLLVEQLSGALTPAQRRYFKNIKDAGNHLLELINEVLDLSKVEAGRLDIRPEPIRLSSLLEPVLAATTEAAASAGLTFERDAPEDLVVRVDPGRMRQIMFNLLSNAVKFTPRGGRVALRIEARGRDLFVQVSDTGMGIPDEKKSRVFGTFERLHEGRSEASGTGLGLALTKKLVELHGGSIGFESAESRGSIFHVVLADAVTSPVRGPRILVVEDDRRDAELLAALAGRLGVATELVGTAASARDAVHRDAPLAILLDLRLPDERGEALLEELKSDPRTRTIPVLVVSVEDDEGRSRPLGADDHLTKPIDRERVSAWITRHVAARTEVAAPAS